MKRVSVYKTGPCYLPAVAIALHICSALGQVDLIDYLLSELPVPIRLLNTVSTPRLLKAKGIEVPEIKKYDEELSLIEVAVLLNQQQMLHYLLSNVSMDSNLKRDPYCTLWTKAIIDKKRKYKIGVGSTAITNWLRLAIKWRSYECVVILFRHFETEIIRTEFDGPLTKQIRVLLHTLSRSPGMFSLFETIEEILLPVLTVDILDFEGHFTTSTAGVDVDHVFSILIDSLQSLLWISATEDAHCTTSDRNQLCSSKPAIRILLGQTDKWKIWRRHLLRLYLCVRMLFNILREELGATYPSNLELVAELEQKKNFEANTSHNEFDRLVNSIIEGTWRLMKIELAHPEIWLHAKLADGCYYRIPPLTVLFSWQVSNLFSNAIHMGGAPTIISFLHPHLSMLFEFFLDKHSKAKGDNGRNEIGLTDCKRFFPPARTYWPEYLQFFILPNRRSLEYAVRMICKSENLLNEPTFIEFFHRCLNHSAMVFKTWRSLSEKPDLKFVQIVELDYISSVADVVDPFWTLNQWESYPELQRNIRTSWTWAEQFIHKIIEPFIENILLSRFLEICQ